MQQTRQANVLVFFRFAACHCCLLVSSRFRSGATLRSNKCASQFVETQTDTALCFSLPSLKNVPLVLKGKQFSLGLLSIKHLSFHQGDRAKTKVCVLVESHCAFFSTATLESELPHEYENAVSNLVVVLRRGKNYLRTLRYVCSSWKTS